MVPEQEEEEEEEVDNDDRMEGPSRLPLDKGKGKAVVYLEDLYPPGYPRYPKTMML